MLMKEVKVSQDVIEEHNYWKQKIRECRHELETHDGKLLTDPKKLAPILEKLMVLQCLEDRSIYAVQKTVEYYNEKIDKQSETARKELLPDVSGWFFGQLWSTIIYIIILFGSVALFTLPTKWVCGKSDSKVCLLNTNVRHAIYGSEH